MFFLIYINDLVNSLKSVSFQLYADDTVLYVTDANGRKATKIIQKDLNALAHWCDANKLSLNAKKTKQMIFGTSHQLRKFGGDRLQINGKIIQCVPSFKYLGVTLDPKLSFGLHIKQVKNTVTHKMFMLSKVRCYLNNEALLTVYKSMVLPYFDYVDVVIAGTSLNLLSKLQKLQDKCLKICLNITEKCESNALHNRAKVAKLSDRREMHVNNFVFRLIQNGSLMPAQTRDGTQTRTSSAPYLDVLMPVNDTFKHSLAYFGATQWNTLLASFRKNNSLVSFRNRQECDLKRKVY